MKTCFIVSEYGGEQWEYYEFPVKVFLSKENAENFIKTESTEITKDSLSISPESFQMAVEIALDDFPDDKTTSLPELICMTGKFPEWSLEDLKVTDKYLRRKENNWVGFRIEEVEICQ